MSEGFVQKPFDTSKKKKKKGRWHGETRDNNSRIVNEDRLFFCPPDRWDRGKSVDGWFYEHASGRLMRDAIYVERVWTIGEVIRTMANRDLIGRDSRSVEDMLKNEHKFLYQFWKEKKLIRHIKI